MKSDIWDTRYIRLILNEVGGPIRLQQALCLLLKGIRSMPVEVHTLKGEGALFRPDILHMSCQASVGRCKELGTLARVRPSSLVSGLGSILGLSV
jgi:hypothetical protein